MQVSTTLFLEKEEGACAFDLLHKCLPKSQLLFNKSLLELIFFFSNKSVCERD